MRFWCSSDTFCMRKADEATVEYFLSIWEYSDCSNYKETMLVTRKTMHSTKQGRLHWGGCDALRLQAVCSTVACQFPSRIGGRPNFFCGIAIENYIQIDYSRHTRDLSILKRDPHSIVVNLSEYTLWMAFHKVFEAISSWSWKVPPDNFFHQ